MDMDLKGLSLLIKRLNPKELLEAIDHVDNSVADFKKIQVYHILVEALLNRQTDGDESSEVYARAATQMVYLLSTHGIDVNIQDENGDTALLCYLRAAHIVPLSDDLVVAFLRCGTDCCLKNKDDEDILQYILKRDELPKQIRARVLEYMPGVWRAVESDDACTVRRLINQWCHIKTVKNGMSVLQLAYSKGTENIIRVISGIGPSMDVAHSVLAGDIVTAKKMLQSSCHVNINLKNLAEMGATPLFYAMCNNDLEMTELLLKHGARLDCGMQGENLMELPLYFATLSHIPRIDTDILRKNIPEKPVPVDQLYYMGRNVIFYCIEHQVDVELFYDILKSCTAHVLTQKIEGNINPREFAVLSDRKSYVAKIDIVVADWCSQEDQHFNRNTLFLHGYPFVLPLTVMDRSPNDRLAKNMQLAEEFECFKIQLQEATISGNTISVTNMLNTISWSDKGVDVCLADCRVCGDGQPLLHKAVLHGHDDVVAVLVQYVLQNTRRKLDSFRDQYFRTAMHYLYGMENGSKTLTSLLEDSGMSEYAMDKDGRSPLAFKDRRGLEEMKDLLDYHRRQDFSEPEPDPWSVNLPLPITGFLKQRLNERHEKKKKEKAMYDGISHGKQARKNKSDKIKNDQQKPKGLSYLPEGHTGSHYLQEGSLTISETSSSGPKLYQKQLLEREPNMFGNFYQHYTHEEKSQKTVVDYQIANQTGILENGCQKFNTVVSVNPESGRNFRSDVFHRSNFKSLIDDDVSTSLQDASDLSSEGDSLYEDYEGDQSDVESEGEGEGRRDRYCSIL